MEQWSTKDEYGNTEWFKHTLKIGTATEKLAMNLLTNYYGYAAELVADKHLGWDIVVSKPDYPDLKPLKIDVKHSNSWLNVGLGFDELVVRNSPADIFMYVCDCFPSGNQYLFIDVEALRNFPKELLEKRYNKKQEKEFWFANYRDLRDFCKEKNYLFTYRQINL